jgi:hypothetical protein
LKSGNKPVCNQSGNEPKHHFASAGKPIRGGKMLEDIPAAEHIKEVEKRIKVTPPLLELEEKDAKGLGHESKDE